MPDPKENQGLQEALASIEETKRTGGKVLSLRSLGLTAIPGTITQLSELEELDLYDNKIAAIPDTIAQLSRLRELDLASNEIAAIPDAFAQLSGLRRLRLMRNRLDSIPEVITQLPRLNKLALGGNQITAIPRSIVQLSKLEGLYLWQNQITDIPDFLSDLSHLRELYLQENQIAAIPEAITRLSRLLELSLDSNRISDIPDFIGKLSQLKYLNLEQNRISAVPDTVSQLTALQTFLLGNNQISAIPNSVARLTELQILALDNNRLTVVPEELAQLTKLQGLFLNGNPALGIPQEILGPSYEESLRKGTHVKPPQEILAYLRQAGDSRPLNEAKLILVGQGAVGKTSLVKALSTGKFKKGERTTEGIKISDWECPLSKREKATVHIWDFGGQEMMHATHQFFLTQRSLYLLVLNRRTGGVEREADYWFRLIRAFGGKEAPVIVVLNKQKSEPFDVNREGWLERYRGNVRAFVSTDCEDKRSITELRRRIVEELERMESLKARFPRRWFTIKNALSQMVAEHISFEDYRKLCHENGETDSSSQSSLASFLHDLGIALNYRQDPRLRFNYVLKPEWVTQGIYALLHAFVRSKGVFTHTEAETELAKKQYSPDDTQFILGLMERFELSFPLGDKHNRVLIPELLDDQQPKDAGAFKPEECLNFGYKYPVLTEGLLPRFIARTHHLGKPETRWKSGVILEDQSTGCRALVRADAPEAEVRVHIEGPQDARRELLGMIRYNFDVIHSDYEFKPVAQVYAPAAPQKPLSVDELEALALSKATTVPVVLPDKTVINQDIASLISPLETPDPLKIFLSYSHKDEDSIEELKKDLKLMERNGLVRPWYDRALTAGDQWEPSLLQELNAADIVVCQLSRNYLSSDSCMAELNAVIQRNAILQPTLVAYVLTDCGWKEVLGLKAIQLLPIDGKPLSDWSNPDKYWRAVAEGIQKAIKKVQARRSLRVHLKLS